MSCFFLCMVSFEDSCNHVNHCQFRLYLWNKMIVQATIGHSRITSTRKCTYFIHKSLTTRAFAQNVPSQKKVRDNNIYMFRNLCPQFHFSWNMRMFALPLSGSRQTNTYTLHNVRIYYLIFVYSYFVPFSFNMDCLKVSAILPRGNVYVNLICVLL